MKWAKWSRSDGRSSLAHSFFFIIGYCTSQQLQHFFDAGYLKKAIGLMKSFNTRWIWSFSFAFRNRAIALSIFRSSLPILGCSLTAKLAVPRIGSDWNINRSFLRLHRSFAASNLRDQELSYSHCYSQ